MDRFDAMAAFIAVTDLNGFAPAARKLGLSTSAVTRHVAALEDRLGVRLLNRTTRAVSLTDAGMRYLERSRRILADLDDADQMAGSERGAPLGRLVVSAPQVFGRLHVAPLVCAFMTRHPKITAELLLSDRMVNLVEDGVDLAVRIGKLTDSSDIARKVGAVRRVLVASPDYLAAQGVPRLPAELSEHHLIAFTALARPDRWSFWSAGTQHDVQVRPRLVTNSADAAIWHASQGGGLTLALSYQVADQVREGRLSVVLEDFEPQPYPVQIVYPTSRLLSVKVRAFLEQAVATRDWNFLDLAAAA
ncbi:LysR substrate-binding domain-containing protein [Devosia sp.]|uniref:LysR family transcriptional regulator n=1 Tax=Devosia sp. TaxID=1871048 RepID=UPI003BAB77E9